jgi:hypothetical protein
MRIALLALFASFLVYSVSLAQLPFTLKLGYERNLDLVKYTKTADVFIDQGFDVWSSTQKAELFCAMPLVHSKWNLGAGVAYKLIQHKVKDYFVYSPYQSSANGNTYYKELEGDAESTSKSIGLKLEVSRIIHQREMFFGSIGLNTEWYFLEFYNSTYTKSTISASETIEAEPKMVDTQKNFFFSSCNLSTFYRFEFTPKSTDLSLAVKLSLGTNLYSDWDQFSKYVWIGLGGELGIPFRKKGHAISTSSKVK